jgi:TonB family protein
MILRSFDRGRARIPRPLLPLAALLSLAPALFAGCAYFNTFYYARQHWTEAERARLESEEKPGATNTPAIDPARQGLPEAPPVPKRALDLYEKCMKKCAKVLTEYEDSRWVDDALLLMGKCAVMRGEYATGLRKFEELIEFYPNSDLVHEARLQIGIAHLHEGSRALAISSLQAVIDDPKDDDIAVEAHYQIGRAYLANGDSAAALEALGVFVMENEGHHSWAAANRTLAAIDLARGEPTRAREAYERLEPSPRSDWPAYRETRLAIAQCLRQEGRHEEAEWVLEELLMRMTDVRDSALVDYEMALILQEAAGDEAAAQRFADVAHRFPRTEAAARALYQRGIILYEQDGDLFRARNAFDSVLVHGAQTPEAALAKERGQKIARRLALDEQLAALLQRIAAGVDQPEPEPQPGAEAESGAPSDARSAAPGAAGAVANAESLRAASEGLDSALTVSPPPSLLAPDSLPERVPGEDSMLVRPSTPDTPRLPAAAPDSIAQAVAQDQEQPPTLAEGSLAPELGPPPVPPPPASLRDALAPPRATPANDPRQHPEAGAQPGSQTGGLNMAITGGEPTLNTSEYLSSLSADSLQVIFARADSAGRESLAQIYVQIGEAELLDLRRVDLAMAAYETVALSFPGTTHEPRALLAIAWIDAHQLDRQAEADSIYRRILGEHPDTRFARGAALALGMEVPMSEEEMIEDPSLSYDEDKVLAAERAARAAAVPQQQVETVARRGEEIPTPPGFESADQNPFFTAEDSLRAAALDSAAAANPMALTAPRALRLATPDYPLELEEDGIVGTVVVEVTVDISGRVMLAEVLESDNEMLNDLAVTAAENSTFTPARGAENRATVKFRFPPPRQSGQTQQGQQNNQQQQGNQQGDVPPEP